MACPICGGDKRMLCKRCREKVEAYATSRVDSALAQVAQVEVAKAAAQTPRRKKAVRTDRWLFWALLITAILLIIGLTRFAHADPVRHEVYDCKNTCRVDLWLSALCDSDYPVTMVFRVDRCVWISTQ